MNTLHSRKGIIIFFSGRFRKPSTYWHEIKRGNFYFKIYFWEKLTDAFSELFKKSFYRKKVFNILTIFLISHKCSTKTFLK